MKNLDVVSVERLCDKLSKLLNLGIRKSVWAPGGADDGAHGL